MTVTRSLFISYRRQDAAFPAGWLYEQLVNRFGEPHVFKDVDSIRPGEDFVNVIGTAVRSCHSLLVVIGPKWLSITDKHGRRRIDDPADFIRLEIETAIAHGVQIIPVLVLEAEMPSRETLPPSIAALARRNAIQISSNRFQADLARLIQAVDDERNNRENMTQAHLPVAAPPQPWLLADRYELVAVLGGGGMCEVHRAVDVQLGRDVAVKVLRADLARDPRYPLQLRREAEVAASLRHPAIVAVYDTGEIRIELGLLPYIVMEYVSGQTLRDILMTAGSMSQQRAMEIVADVCAALDLGHNRGIVHGDIQPSNIMISGAGAVKVLNFGVAAALGQGDSGTSPDRVRDDIYAAGCVLYELLTGRAPYPGGAPASPSELNSAISSELDTIVRTAMFADPEGGYTSAAALRSDLLRMRRAIQTTSVALPAITPRLPRPQPTPVPVPVVEHGGRRKRGLGTVLATSVTVLLILGFVGVGGYWLLGGASSAPTQAPATTQITAPPGASPAAVSPAAVPPAPPPPVPRKPSPTRRAPQTVIVPDLSGFDVDEARNRLASLGLEVGVDEIESEGRPGSVDRCEPPAGTSVTVGSKVVLKVARTMDDSETPVPRVVGLSVSQAQRELSGAGFTNIKVQITNVGDPGKKGIVVEQDPEGTTKASTDTLVTLVVGDGSGTGPG